eukprot:UC4_evm1s141
MFDGTTMLIPRAGVYYLLNPNHPRLTSIQIRYLPCEISQNCIRVSELSVNVAGNVVTAFYDPQATVEDPSARYRNYLQSSDAVSFLVNGSKVIQPAIVDVQGYRFFRWVNDDVSGRSLGKAIFETIDGVEVSVRAMDGQLLVTVKVKRHGSPFEGKSSGLCGSPGATSLQENFQSPNVNRRVDRVVAPNCLPGRTGALCNALICPGEVPCSTRGKCISDALRGLPYCECDSGFKGESCEQP